MSTASCQGNGLQQRQEEAGGPPHRNAHSIIDIPRSLQLDVAMQSGGIGGVVGRKRRLELPPRAPLQRSHAPSAPTTPRRGLGSGGGGERGSFSAAT
ncbi:unnamed protein product [Lampetra planeri]